MAPRTRSSGLANRTADPTASADNAVTIQLKKDLKVSAGPPKRGRGRPPKKQTLVAAAGSGSNSSSSVPTPATLVSEGEYSTPATSSNATPAPPTEVIVDNADLPGQRRLKMELPSDDEEGDDEDYGINAAQTQKAKSSKLTPTIRSRQLRNTSSLHNEDGDEDGSANDPKQAASIALARRLQEEEDEAAEIAILIDKERNDPKQAASIALARRLQEEDDEAAEVAILTDQERTGASTRSAAKKRKLESPDAQASSKKQKTVVADSASLNSPTLSPDPDDVTDSPVSDEEDSDLIPEDTESETDGVMPMIVTTPTTYRRRTRVRMDDNPSSRRARNERRRLELNHPELKTMWVDLEKMPDLNAGTAAQPAMISLRLKPFQLQGLAWMKAMEKTPWKGGLLGDEMGLGKTIQAVSLIVSDYPAKAPSLVLLPPVALGQWQDEIAAYTDNRLKTIVLHGTNTKAKDLSAKELRKFDVIIMSYNSLESLYRKQEKGVKRKDGLYKEKSVVHQIRFHRVILDEAHCIKTRTTMTARACFALNVKYRWCLTGTPLQNRIGEFFSLIRFLEIKPYASYFCRECPCSTLEWSMGDDSRCNKCHHGSMRHVSVFNQELLNPIQRYGNTGEGQEAFRKLRLLTNRLMLRRLKKDHTNVMELPVKEIYVDRQFFGEEENDFASSIMSNTKRQFNTYVAQQVLLNNYANIFGLIMQMRQVADHPDLILRKSGEGGQNILVCCICDETAEEAIRSKCKHDFCRQCATSYLASQDEPDCPRCHIPLSIDLEQPSIEQDQMLVKKSSIINRIKMENWTSSSKIELLVHKLHKLRSDSASHKSIIFSQFTTMLQLIEWRLRRAGITTVMLDGSMTPAQRQASIKHFMEKPEVECFLVSLKAGGVALNLTEASHVFIVDPWWNPAAEWQSADRCHRIGQTRPCTITRLCIEDSVESRMVLLQEKKTHMIHSTINSDDAAIESLSPADLMFLFRGT